MIHSRSLPRIWTLLLLTMVVSLTTASLLTAAPSFGAPVVRRQPDGTVVHLRLWGDEFGMVAETPEGFTVVRDRDGSWCFARRAAHGGSLESTGVRVGSKDPERLGLPRHIRIDHQTDQARRLERRQAAGLRVDGNGHWVRRAEAEAAARAAGKPAPPGRPTTGTYKGLCLLIDFTDDQGSISRAEIDAAMNQAGYTGMGNNGSVRDYFTAVSGGRVTYTNVLPSPSTWTTGYYRARNPRSHYDSSQDYYGIGAQELINEALADLKSKEPGIFSQLNYDSSNAAYALNVLYAGDRPDDWATGLWPHQGELDAPFDVGSGRVITYYQISDLPDPLPLGTICHENGHLLCDFPDLYSYEDPDQTTPVASWCLMGLGGYGGVDFQGFAPTGVCGYLRYRAGWTNAVELTAGMGGTMLTAKGIDGTPTGGNVFLIRKSSSEYFLIENRHAAGIDAYLPASGLAIYHVDERGSNTFKSRATTRHWECALVQADGSTSFQSGYTDWGSSRDVFSSQGQARFSYQTDPPALWYDRKPTTLMIEDISSPGATTTFTIDQGPGWIGSVTTGDEDDSSHCGSGSGFSFLGVLFAAAFLTLRLRPGRRSRR